MNIKARIAKLLPLSLISTLALSLGLMALPAFALSLPTSCNDAANEVVWCGAATPEQLAADYQNGDGHNSAASIQNIYSYFGISGSDINGMTTTAVAGTVTKSGDVVVNGQVVATNAITVGRDYISGSTQASYGGTTFYKRPPSVSFLQDSLDAFVVMTNNRFAFAVLSSCGNSVVATPTPTPTPTPAPAPTPTPTPTPNVSPNYQILKEVAVDGSNQYGPDVQVHPNTKVDFKVIVTSTGSGTVDGLVVKDTMPSDLVYDQNSLTLNGNQEATTDASNFFAGGLNVGTLPAGATDTFWFSAIAGANQNNANCTNETLENSVSMQATGLTTENANANVSVECVPVAPTTPTPATPASTTSAPVPVQLVNTGPGSTMGVFVGVSLAGAVVYNLIIRRKLSSKS